MRSMACWFLMAAWFASPALFAQTNTNLLNAGKAPMLPAFVTENRAIKSMTAERDKWVAIQQALDAELAQLRAQIEAEQGRSRKAELVARAAEVKNASAEAKSKIDLIDNEIQKRAGLLMEQYIRNPAALPDTRAE